MLTEHGSHLVCNQNLVCCYFIQVFCFQKLNYKSISIPGKSSHSSSESNQLLHSLGEAEDDEERHSPSPPESLAYSKYKAAEDGLIDWERSACLLCKRQLQSRELLQKHVEMSELHLACYWQSVPALTGLEQIDH